jgi:phosphatidylinositol glycan class N
LKALGYTHREVFSVLYMLATTWPAFYGKQFMQENKILITTWGVACLAMSAFTFLPVVKIEDATLMFVSALFPFRCQCADLSIVACWAGF